MNAMGLKNAPGQFQRMMDDVLSPVSDNTTPYIDDVLVGTQAVEGEDLYENQNRDVRRTLDCLVGIFFCRRFAQVCIFLSLRWSFVVTSWGREYASRHQGN